MRAIVAGIRVTERSCDKNGGWLPPTASRFPNSCGRGPQTHESRCREGVPPRLPGTGAGAFRPAMARVSSYLDPDGFCFRWRASRCTAEFDAWKIHRNVEGDIDIVGEEIKCDMGNDLKDFAAIESRSTQGLHIRVRDLAAVLDKF